MNKIVVAGGSGFVGRALVDLLVKMKYEVVVLSRTGEPIPGAKSVQWNIEQIGPWAAAIEGAHAVINLAGSPIGVPWNKANRHLILHSRVQSTRILGEAIRRAENKPQVWVNASAIGFYGDTGSAEVDERRAAGPRNFLTDTAVAWEETFKQEHVPGVRKSIVRLGIVLGTKGGALPPLVKATKMFLGGCHGPGSQYMSWVHVDDAARIFLHCVEEDIPLANATTPIPCTNRFFSATLRGVVGRPWSPGIPAFVLRIASWFGAPDPTLLIMSQRVMPKAMMDAGFRFTYEEVRDTLLQLLR